MLIVKARKQAAKITNAFAGSRTRPTRTQLSEALGGAIERWDEFVAQATSAFGLKPEWNSFSPKYGWSLRLKKKDRNIVYLSPERGRFMTAFILGGRAVAAVRAGGLPEWVREMLDQAPRYPEGTGLRIPVTETTDLGALLDLVRIKLEH